MRRHAYGSLASGAVLFAASALGLMGTWALITAVVMLMAGAFTLAIVMEDTPAEPPLTTVAGAASAGPDLAA
jgi:hypothetical protein